MNISTETINMLCYMLVTAYQQAQQLPPSQQRQTIEASLIAMRDLIMQQVNERN